MVPFDLDFALVTMVGFISFKLIRFRCLSFTDAFSGHIVKQSKIYFCHCMLDDVSNCFVVSTYVGLFVKATIASGRVKVAPNEIQYA